MSRTKFFHILWIISIAIAALAILGYYKIVVVKYLSDYNFELLLIGFVGLLILRLFKK